MVSHVVSPVSAACHQRATSRRPDFRPQGRGVTSAPSYQHPRQNGLVVEDHFGGFRVEPLRPVGVRPFEIRPVEVRPVEVRVDGRPVGVQFIGRQHTDRMVLDLAAAWERFAPWPLVAT